MGIIAERTTPATSLANLERSFMSLSPVCQICNVASKRKYLNTVGFNFRDHAIAKAPSVILTDVEHQAITKKLNDFWKAAKKKSAVVKDYRVSQEELRKFYQDAYKDHPHWLQSIQHLFKQIP